MQGPGPGGPDGDDAERERLGAVLAAHGYGDGRAAALLGSEAALALDAIPQLVWRSRDLGRWVWASRQWCAFTGQGQTAARALGWLDAVHPDDRDRTMAAWEAAPGRGFLEVEHRIRRGPDGHRWFETRAAPRALQDGTREWFGTCTDVHDLRMALERERGLLAELQHRVRNMLASLRVVVRRGFDSSGSKADFSNHLDGRLAALARMQGLVASDPFARVDLATLVSQELHACLSREGEEAQVRGPAVSLSLRAAESLGLAFHELATNALKFGSPGLPGRPLRVTWRVEPWHAPPGRALALTWKEPPPGPARRPRKEGLGTEILLRRLPYELGGRSALDFAQDGLAFELVLPVGEDARPEGGP